MVLALCNAEWLLGRAVCYGGTMTKLTEAQLAEECECHCERRHHESINQYKMFAGKCWLCYGERVLCYEYRKHHHVD